MNIAGTLVVDRKSSFSNIKVLRSQLPLKNAFYPDTPADDTVECDAVEAAVKLCRVCGCRGPLVCGKCKKVGYCGQLHQKLDWKIHKQHCGVSAELKAPPNEILFPEFEIVIEQEEQQVENGKQETEKEAEKRRLREYEDIAKSCQAGGLAEMSEADLNDLAESKEDKAFGRFKKAIESYESQVLRYNRHGSPLWISDHGILKPSSVPTCANCKGRRTFEFQLMPQMLNELKNYDLDWGVIAVYTCEKDCDVGGKYVPEFCYKQDVMKSDDEAKIDLGSLKLEAENAREESGSEAAVCDDGNSAEVPKKNVVKASKKAKQVKATKMFKENDEWE